MMPAPTMATAICRAGLGSLGTIKPAHALAALTTDLLMHLKKMIWRAAPDAGAATWTLMNQCLTGMEARLTTLI